MDEDNMKLNIEDLRQLCDSKFHTFTTAGDIKNLIKQIVSEFILEHKRITSYYKLNKHLSLTYFDKLAIEKCLMEIIFKTSVFFTHTSPLKISVPPDVRQRVAEDFKKISQTLFYVDCTWDKDKDKKEKHGKFDSPKIFDGPPSSLEDQFTLVIGLNFSDEDKMEEAVNYRISMDRPPSQIYDLSKVVYPRTPVNFYIDEIFSCAFDPYDEHFKLWVSKKKMDDIYLELVGMCRKLIKGFVMETPMTLFFNNDKNVKVLVYCENDKPTHQMVRGVLSKFSKHIYYNTDTGLVLDVGMNPKKKQPAFEGS